MPSEKENAALRDILFQISAAERFARGETFESLRDDLMRLYAIIRALEIISEASRRLSNELKARYPDIAWREMAAAGMRSRGRGATALLSLAHFDLVDLVTRSVRFASAAPCASAATTSGS
jgi:uncharacterized protein with HEPN domain